MPDSTRDGGPAISHRKADHIDLCIDGDVGFKAKSNLFEDVDFVHDALPELRVDRVDLRSSFAGRPLRVPLLMAAMTGGVDRADAINRDLASVAEELGMGFAFGSQRPLLSHGVRAGYQVRDVAPTALLLGNIGVVQARQSSTAALADLVGQTGVDALAVHLNPAMEVVQPEGDDDFEGGIDTIARLVAELPVPIVVKETGCGLSRAVAARVQAVGARFLDTSGSGGTSWVAVERQRAADDQRAVGDTFWDWGIPTAASVAQVQGLGLGFCATGGVSDGLMAAKAIALGADCAGVARPFLQAWARGGRAAVRARAVQMTKELRIACLLTGSADLAALRRCPLVIGPRLRRWVPPGSPLAQRLLSGGEAG